MSIPPPETVVFDTPSKPIISKRRRVMSLRAGRSLQAKEDVVAGAAAAQDANGAASEFEEDLEEDPADVKSYRHSSRTIPTSRARAMSRAR